MARALFSYLYLLGKVYCFILLHTKIMGQNMPAVFSVIRFNLILGDFSCCKTSLEKSIISLGLHAPENIFLYLSWS